MERKSHKEHAPSYRNMSNTIATLRDRYRDAGIRPLFVGSLIPRLLTPDTIDQTGLDHLERTVRVPVTDETLTPVWKNNARDDLIIIVNHREKERIENTIEETSLLLKWGQYARCPVKVGAVRYPHWGKHDSRFDVPSHMEVDMDGRMHFVSGKAVSRAIPSETLAPWEYIFEQDGQAVISIPSINPVFLGLWQMIRSPAKEDANDVLMKLRTKGLETAADQSSSYDSSAWLDFLKERHAPENHDIRGRLSMLFYALVHGGNVVEK